MAEITLGILVLLGAVATLVGIAPMLGLPDAFALVGLTGTSVIAGIGALLVLHGTYRRVLRAGTGDQSALRMLGLTTAALAAVAALTLGVPLMVEPLNLVTVGGFPMGFYLAAQGVLIGLVILTFLYARTASAIEPRSD